MLRLREMRFCGFWLFFAAAAAHAALRPSSLSVEQLRNPQGIDVLKPHLSWKLQPTNLSARGERQSAYQIQVSTVRKALFAGRSDLWDTGKVASDQPILVEYSGKLLSPAAFGRLEICESLARVTLRPDPK